MQVVYEAGRKRYTASGAASFTQSANRLFRNEKCCQWGACNLGYVDEVDYKSAAPLQAKCMPVGPDY